MVARSIAEHIASPMQGQSPEWTPASSETGPLFELILWETAPIVYGKGGIAIVFLDPFLKKTFW